MKNTKSFNKILYSLFFMEELYNEKKAKKNFRGRKLDDKRYKKNGVPGWTRTNGPLINSQML